MKARVTMRDVARAAGVSPMTVSRALRDDKTVGDSTRARIQKAVRELGYVYDTTAQAFRSQKSGFVAVTLPSINNANFADTFAGLSEGLAESRMQILLGSTGYRTSTEEDLVTQLLARNPQAFVLTGSNHTEDTRRLLKYAQIPVIEMWDMPAEPLGHVVGFSNAEAMDKLVRHLAQSGRRKLAFIGGSEGADLRGSARRAGAIASAKALGLPDMVEIDAGVPPLSMQNGVRAVELLGDRVTEFDALVCVSDPVAFGCLSACRRRGLSVPGDIAITGFGAFEVAGVSDPRITTVGVHAREIGAQVAGLLNDVFKGTGDQPRRIDVGSELVLGETA